MKKNAFATFLEMNGDDVVNKTETIGLAPHCLGGNMNGKTSYLKMGLEPHMFQRVTVHEDMLALLLLVGKSTYHKQQDLPDRRFQTDELNDEEYGVVEQKLIQVNKALAENNRGNIGWRDHRYLEKGNDYDLFYKKGDESDYDIANKLTKYQLINFVGFLHYILPITAPNDERSVATDAPSE